MVLGALSLLSLLLIGADEGWQPVACPPGPLTLAQRFDVGAPVATAWTAWRANVHGQSARMQATVEPTGGPEGQPALRVDYTFTGRAGLEYIDVGAPVVLDTRVAGQGWSWLVQGAEALPLRLRATDTSGEWHQFEVAREAGGGWQRAALTFDNAAAHWGGDGNGHLDYPLTVRGILLDRLGDGYQATGTLRLADLRVAAAATRPATLKVEVTPKRFGNLYAPGETVKVRVGAEATGVRWRLLDHAGRERRAGAGSLVDLGALAPGYGLVLFERLVGGQCVESVGFHYAALPPRQASAPRNDFVGFCTHFGQGLAYPLESMVLLRDYGIHRFRDEIGWGAVEATKGQYALPLYAQQLTAKARELGMQPLFILDYANRHYDQGGYPNSPEALKGYAAYGVWLANALQGLCDEFEIWNEWIGGCGMGGKPGDHGPEAYGRLLAVAYPALKAARPELTVVGIGGEYGAKLIDNVSAMVRSAGPGRMEAFSIHPYCYPHAPEQRGLAAQMVATREKLVAAGAPSRMWLTEIGWPTHVASGGVSEPVQAAQIVRALALLQASGAVERTYLYDFKDDGPRAEYNEHRFGVVRHQALNCAPKPAAAAVSTFARLTAGAKVLRAEERDGAHGVVYGLADGQELLVAWTTKPESGVTVGGQIAGVEDLVGAPLAPGAPVLAAQPVFVRGRALGLKAR
jgi:hypothetical protein